jgi:hypothetical protein
LPRPDRCRRPPSHPAELPVAASDIAHREQIDAQRDVSLDNDLLDLSDSVFHVRLYQKIPRPPATSGEAAGFF